MTIAEYTNNGMETNKMPVSMFGPQEKDVTSLICRPAIAIVPKIMGIPQATMLLMRKW